LGISLRYDEVRTGRDFADGNVRIKLSYACGMGMVKATLTVQ